MSSKLFEIELLRIPLSVVKDLRKHIYPITKKIFPYSCLLEL